MEHIKFFTGNTIPMEMHKTRIVQKLSLKPIEHRLEAMRNAGNNTFLLSNEDVFLDMLTDSGVNAMSDKQLAAMMEADDSYAGSMTFTKLEKTCQRLFGKTYFIPAHQGRACEHLIAKLMVKKGDIIPMNYHFTTTKAHIVIQGGAIDEIPIDEAWVTDSEHPFKGNMSIEKLKAVIKKHGAKNIPFVRIESGTNLIGGQPHSLENLKQVRAVCDQHNLKIVLDASLLADNLHFIKEREEACKAMSIEQITKAIADQCDIIYFSARKLGCARGGGIVTSDQAFFLELRELIPLFEGFSTYGGMSVREMEAINIGLIETMDEEMINQGPIFIEFMVNELKSRGVPVITPAGGLGCHLNALAFLDHVPQNEYPAGALASALYIISGIRGMERGTMSEQRDEHGNEPLADLELLRLALPRRVFTLSQIKYAIDRVDWLYRNRHLVGGLTFVEEPKNLRFFFGRLETTSPWQEKLVEKLKLDMEQL